ncbi:MAG: ABA4-like family protein [Granulosicoccus sp.]
MTPDNLFSLSSTLVLPAWLILIFAPRRWPVLNAIPAYVVPLALSALYTVLVLRYFSEAGGGYGSLSEVRQLFTSDMILVAGWVHYLAFDLFVGAWAAATMGRAGVSRVIQGFILPVTFLFGPAGFLLALSVSGSNQALVSRRLKVRRKNPDL